VRRKIDKDWFTERIAESQWGSQRQFVPNIETRPSGSPMRVEAWTRMMAGEREMTLFEAVQIADLLDVSLKDIVFRMGMSRA